MQKAFLIEIVYSYKILYDFVITCWLSVILQEVNITKHSINFIAMTILIMFYFKQGFQRNNDSKIASIILYGNLSLSTVSFR